MDVCSTQRVGAKGVELLDAYIAHNAFYAGGTEFSDVRIASIRLVPVAQPCRMPALNTFPMAYISHNIHISYS